MDRPIEREMVLTPVDASEDQMAHTITLMLLGRRGAEEEYLCRVFIDALKKKRKPRVFKDLDATRDSIKHSLGSPKK